MRQAQPNLDVNTAAMAGARHGEFELFILYPLDLLVLLLAFAAY